MELSSTAYVILGLLNGRPRTGYEIKAAVDRSTRFFWAASYGQIYPELKRLAAAGMIEGRPAASGRRKRIVYSLTRAGRAQLRRWLEEPADTFELRDEGLLKLFFADALPPRATLAGLDAKGERHARVAERLREIEREMLEGGDGSECLVLRYGIEMNEWIASWCRRERARLEREQRRAA